MQKQDDNEQEEENAQVAIFWDLQNTRMPQVDIATSANLIRKRAQSMGTIVQFAAIADMKKYVSQREQFCLIQNGVTMMDVPASSEKNITDKIFIAEMCLFVHDYVCYNKKNGNMTLFVVTSLEIYAPCMFQLLQRNCCNLVLCCSQKEEWMSKCCTECIPWSEIEFETAPSRREKHQLVQQDELAAKIANFVHQTAPFKQNKLTRQEVLAFIVNSKYMARIRQHVAVKFKDVLFHKDSIMEIRKKRLQDDNFVLKVALKTSMEQMNAKAKYLLSACKKDESLLFRTIYKALVQQNGLHVQSMTDLDNLGASVDKCMVHLMLPHILENEDLFHVQDEIVEKCI